MSEFRELPDLAVRSLGGSVRYANDEAFGARENLIMPGPAVFEPAAFGHRGKVYDGWETRRRREPGHDEAIVRLGVSGLVAGVVIDTSWFTGNHPAEASVDGLCADGDPSVADLLATDRWRALVPRSPLKGDTATAFAVSGAGADSRVTHVRLRIYPDGGVARLRVHGVAVPDPALLDTLGVADLAALEHGGRVLDCSDRFYSTPTNLLLPGPARSLGEGWETARRRGEGNEWVRVRLAGEARLRLAELDTSYFLHNSPGWASLRGRAGAGDWVELLPRRPLQPDTRHRVRLTEAGPVTEVRLDVYPDGGLARLRLFGSLTPAGRAELTERWSR